MSPPSASSSSHPDQSSEHPDQHHGNKAIRTIDLDTLFVPELPSHPNNDRVNKILQRCQNAIEMVYTKEVDPPLKPPSSRGKFQSIEDGKEKSLENKIFANSYVNLGNIDVVGFDYDYTLVSYSEELQSTIYDMAKTTLVEKMRYPTNLAQFEYDPTFAIRGLAVDMETGWLCQLSYSSDVVLAYNGRQRISDEVLLDTYSGTSTIPPNLRNQRLRPLNDLFSMVEACLLADVVDFFVKTGIPFNPKLVVEDVLKAVGSAHVSGSMHRAVLQDVDKYIEFPPHLRNILERFKNNGKKLWLVSNSQFWYVDAGMRHVVGDDWRELFEVVVVGASKPGFYTENSPFREVSARTGRIKFKSIESLEEGGVYTQGSIQELLRITKTSGSRVLYLGDSLFADLVEARRLYGIATGAIISEVRQEMEKQKGSAMWRYARLTTHVLQHSFRLIQEEMGLSRTEEDTILLDKLEREVSRWRHIQEHVINANFGSIFRSDLTVSKFAASMKRHADLYMSSIQNLRFYSTEQRFYPDGGHESVPFNDPLLDFIIGDDSAIIAEQQDDDHR
eukprot:CAMPEP_0197522094 /NCGR_PEP_ID=MMETSP1318-20131121/7282_1 /TAXON_ID=552666 /ORGANISM="Partenskyella glossopodia, Strain RCC365" /LENGTH=559 /DNA_ID=CAMNT_0043074329 /DNA_START=208 /DNA_END=1887 /DNA_ORIENTATION=-